MREEGPGARGAAAKPTGRLEMRRRAKRERDAAKEASFFIR